MNYRQLGDTKMNVSEISLGTWQLGSKWGELFNKQEALNILNEAVKSGINLFDTADVYKDGLSEKTIGEFIKNCKEKIYVVTKCGRKLSPHVCSMYTKESIKKFVNDSLDNMQLQCLDLILLHCPPTDVYYRPEIFECLDDLKNEGKIKAYGVSVERIEEAIKALDYNISAVEIIFNMFRLRPSELFFKLAKKKKVGIIVRVPLASGVLSGKYSSTTQFGENDHRISNRKGELFDKGETFSGVDYQTALKAVDKLKEIFKTDNLGQFALNYILQFDAVTTVIPGASSAYQVSENVKAVNSKITDTQMKQVEEIYNKYIKNPVHYLW